MTGIDPAARIVQLASGDAIQYDKLLTTLPLDATLGWLGRKDRAGGLVHSSSHIVGVGVRGKW